MCMLHEGTENEESFITIVLSGGSDLLYGVAV